VEIYTWKAVRKKRSTEIALCAGSDVYTVQCANKICEAGYPRNVILFSNFEKQYKLENKLSECEKLIGFDTNIERSKLQLKQLNILRKCMYDAVHAQVILKWEEVLKSVDNMYIIEYAIAEKSDQIAKHLKNWEL
jgi:hypothetical protein